LARAFLGNRIVPLAGVDVFGSVSVDDDRRQSAARKIGVCAIIPAFIVIPAKAGIQYAGLGYLAPDWIPAFAGMTER